MRNLGEGRPPIAIGVVGRSSTTTTAAAADGKNNKRRIAAMAIRHGTRVENNEFAEPSPEGTFAARFIVTSTYCRRRVIITVFP